MLTAIDPDAPGYAPSAYGATLNEAEAWRNATVETLRRSNPRPWGLLVALCMSLFTHLGLSTNDGILCRCFDSRFRVGL